MTIGNHEADYGLAHMLFIGVLTEEVLKNTKSEGLVGTLIDIQDAANEIGRFDIMVDTDKNCIDSYTWQCIPITEENCPRDEALEKIVNEYKDYTDEKYGRVLTRFPRAYTHPQRNMETELGNLLAECMRDQIGADLVILGSGSIRKPSLGPVVTVRDFIEIFPFAEPAFGFRITGKQLRHMVTFMLREESFNDSEHNEWFQFSKGFCCEFDRKNHSVISLKMNGKETSDDDMFTVVMQKFFFDNIGDFLDMPKEEIEKNGRPIEVATKAPNILEEYFKDHERIKLDGEARLIIHQ